MAVGVHRASRAGAQAQTLARLRLTRSLPTGQQLSPAPPPDHLLPASPRHCPWLADHAASPLRAASGNGPPDLQGSPRTIIDLAPPEGSPTRSRCPQSISGWSHLAPISSHFPHRGTSSLPELLNRSGSSGCCVAPSSRGEGRAGWGAAPRPAGEGSFSAWRDGLRPLSESHRLQYSRGSSIGPSSIGGMHHLQHCPWDQRPFSRAAGSEEGSRAASLALQVMRDPQKAAARAWGSAAEQLGVWRRRLMAARAIRAVVKAADQFSKLPPVARSMEDARRAVARRQDALSIQIQAFWRNNSSLMVAVGAGTSILVLDQLLVSLASVFASQPLSVAFHLGCFATSAAAVVGSGVFLRSRTALTIDTVCDIALAKLNGHPGILEVLGAPVSAQSAPVSAQLVPGSSGIGSGATSIGTTSAAVFVGGGVQFRFGLKESPLLLALHFPPRSCVCVFLAKGSEASGFVEVALTKDHGKYSTSLLAVDVQIPPKEIGQGAEVEHQRVYVAGTFAEYKKYERLLSNLRATLLAVAVSETETAK